MSQLKEKANRLRKSRHYASQEIKECMQALLERRTKIRFGVQARRKKLEECRQLNLFLQDVNDVSKNAYRLMPEILCIPIPYRGKFSQIEVKCNFHEFYFRDVKIFICVCLRFQVVCVHF